MLNSVAHIDPIFNDSLETKPRRKGGRPKKQPIAPLTNGFPTCVSQSAYFNVPTVFMDLVAAIDNLAELKVVLYILRHTWGFHEFETPLHITTDEFMYGRKKKGGIRMDSGTGLSKSAVLDGLDRALKHGFIECFIDDHDRARVEHHYRLKIRNEETKEPEPPKHFEDQPTEGYTDQLEPDYPTQQSEDQHQDYDPYAGTIFAQSPEQKIFASEPDPITPSPVVDNSITGSFEMQRSNNRTQESTLRTKEIRITHASENLEDFIRSFPDQMPKVKAKSPAFIRNMITDFSRDLGDQDHIFSNISQAAKIYRNSGLSEDAFMQVLYDARVTAKKATQIKHLNSQGRPNRMPYFFRCLSGVLSRETAV